MPPNALTAVIAIEGCSHAGKSTVIEGMRSWFEAVGLGVCAEYMDLVPPSDAPHIPSATPSEELDALDYFLHVDDARIAAMVATLTPQSGLVMDRSYHSLLAHIHACDQLCGRRVFPEAASRVARARRYATTATIYLDVSPIELLARCSRTNRGPALEVLLSPAYCDAFRAYFHEAYIDPRDGLCLIDGQQPPRDVQREARLRIEEVLKGRAYE